MTDLLHNVHTIKTCIIRTSIAYFGVSHAKVNRNMYRVDAALHQTNNTLHQTNINIDKSDVVEWFFLYRWMWKYIHAMREATNQKRNTSQQFRMSGKCVYFSHLVVICNSIGDDFVEFMVFISGFESKVKAIRGCDGENTRKLQAADRNIEWGISGESSASVG